MTKEEKQTILSYLSYAYKEYRKQLKFERQIINKNFPLISNDYKVAQTRYMQMVCLARDLGIHNPYEEFEMDIDIIQD